MSGSEQPESADAKWTGPSWGLASRVILSEADAGRRLAAAMDFADLQLASAAPKASFTTMFRQQLGWLIEGPIMVGGYVRHWPFFPVIHEISAIEGARSSTMRPPSRFVGAPLGGFWHKHFFSASNIATNMVRELETNFDYLWHAVFAKKLEQVTGRSWEGGEFDETTVNLLTHTMTQHAYAYRRGALKQGTESRMTGDWIIYHEGPSRRIYITLAAHAEERDLDIVAQRIYEAGTEFPNLRDHLSRNGFEPS